MYVTFMLRALDYVDGEDFSRGDAVEVTAAALFAKLKGTDTTLADQLIAQGAFSRADFDRAFQTYEEAMEELLEGRDAPLIVAERWETDRGTVLLGNAAGTPHPTYNYLYLVTKPASDLGEGLTIRLPLARTGVFSSAQPDQVTLSEDGRTLTYACTVPEDAPGLDGITIIQEEGTYNYTVDLSTGVAEEAFQHPEGPPLTPEEEQKAYDDAIRAILEGDYNRRELKRWEGETCTVLLTQNTGVFHAGLTIRLDLVGKPGSPLGAGERMPLPLPLAAPEEYAQPAELIFSSDGQSLTYSCAVRIDVPGMDGVTVIQEKGVYSYTVDLSTGEVTQAFSPLGETAGG